MRYFAKIENGVVLETIVAEQSFVDSIEGTWVEYFRDAKGEPEKKYNPAKKNSTTYDYVNEAFIEPQTFPSWSLNDKFKWEAPIKKPDDTETHFYYWNEEDKQWVMAEIPPEEED